MHDPIYIFRGFPSRRLCVFLQHKFYIKKQFIVTLKLGTILPHQRTFLKNYKILTFQNGGKLNYGKYLVS